MSSYAIPTLLSVCCLTAAGFAAAAEPKRDVKYDTKHERKVLDFWPALKEGEPAPDFVIDRRFTRLPLGIRDLNFMKPVHHFMWKGPMPKALFPIF